VEPDTFAFGDTVVSVHHVGRFQDGGATWTAPLELSAASMELSWLPDATQGRMLGDYISTSFGACGYAGGVASCVFAIHRATAGKHVRITVGTGHARARRSYASAEPDCPASARRLTVRACSRRCSTSPTTPGIPPTSPAAGDSWPGRAGCSVMAGLRVTGPHLLHLCT
jgi:hypothetical protein